MKHPGEGEHPAVDASDTRSLMYFGAYANNSFRDILTTQDLKLDDYSTAEINSRIRNKK
jgi:hypothetical protein